MNKMLTAIYDTIEPIIKELGYSICDIEYKKKYECMNLIIYIDNNNGITLNDCEIVHKAIDEPLDMLDPTNGKPYTLNVSSPGIDRPLRNVNDYKRNIGKMVEVSLFAKVDGNKKYSGEFGSWTDTDITILIDGKPQTFAIKDITIIKPII